jgi:hypothetical protein
MLPKTLKWKLDDLMEIICQNYNASRLNQKLCEKQLGTLSKIKLFGTMKPWSHCGINMKGNEYLFNVNVWKENANMAKSLNERTTI